MEPSSEQASRDSKRWKKRDESARALVDQRDRPSREKSISRCRKRQNARNGTRCIDRSMVDGAACTGVVVDPWPAANIHTPTEVFHGVARR